MTSYVLANGFDLFTPNFTITKDGFHPEAKNNGLMPYYLVFDHRGRLIAHHMGGSYHGGDGQKMIEWVDKLLADAPALYVGEAPYPKTGPLASQIASGKGLATAVKKLEAGLAEAVEAEEKEELERLHAVVLRYRDRALRRALACEGSRPSEVLSRIKNLARSLQGTQLCVEVEAKLETLRASEELKAAVAIEKKFRSIVKAFERIKESKRTDAVVERAVKKLEELIEGRESLPFARTVEGYLANLR